jgi:hypothetical protein
LPPSLTFLFSSSSSIYGVPRNRGEADEVLGLAAGLDLGLGILGIRSTIGPTGSTSATGRGIDARGEIGDEHEERGTQVGAGAEVESEPEPESKSESG